jgi:hypothetical protein
VPEARRPILVLLPLLLALPAPARAQGFREALAAAAREERSAQALGQDRPAKCGFGSVVLTLTRLGRAASTTQEARPDELPNDFPSPGGFFLLHYATTGVDAVPSGDSDSDGTPDWIEAAAAALDSLLARYRDLGWRDPIGDGDAWYDVYFTNDMQQQGYFGLTVATAPFQTTPPYRSASWMELDNDYPVFYYGHEPLTSLRVTAAHEFHHAIQMAYNLPVLDYWGAYQAYGWFAEASAVYHEDVLYDGINDYYNYLPSFLNNPDLSLATYNGAHEYGAVLWPLFLDATQGAETNRLLWTAMSDQACSPRRAHDFWLEEQGLVWIDLWRDFSVWLLHTGSRADPARYFPEGAAYPGVKILTAPTGPASVTLPALAVRFWRALPDTARAGVAVRVDPQDLAAWGVGIAGEPAAGPLQQVSALAGVMEGSGVGVELLDWRDYAGALSWAFTGPNYRTDPDSLHSGTASFESRASDRLGTDRLDGTSFRLLQNYPNPFRPATDPRTWFVFRLEETSEVTLEVRSLGGARLWTHRFADLEAGLHFSADLGVGWDGRDESGRSVPSGVYLLLGRAGGRIETITFSVVR